jgi:DNA-binding transcriptional MerR regulator
MSIVIEPDPQIELKWLSLNDLVELFGVAESTIRRWEAQGVIPHSHRLGGRRLWSAKQLADWRQRLCEPVSA